MPADWEFEYGPREVKGVASSGLRWRYIGMIGASIQYEGADEVSAARADVLMETLCWAHLQSDTQRMLVRPVGDAG